MKNRFFLLLCLIMPFCAVNGQKVKVLSGSFSPLKGEKVLNLQYVYEGLLVGKVSEAEYIEKKVAEYNSDEAGKGDKWKESWSNDRKARYQPKFEELLNKNLEDAGITAKEGNSNAKYTVVVKTTVIEPGFNVGVMKRPAYIEAIVEVVETARPETVVTKMSFEKVPGTDVMGFDYDSAWRISEAYAKMGKTLGNYIVKGVKK